MRTAPSVALVGVTAIWGWTFVVVKDAIAAYPIAAFLALRFVLAAAVLLPAARRSPRSFVTGLPVGILLAAGYLFQTVGLAETRPSDAGLVTGSFVVLTPLLDRAIFGVRPARAVVVAVALAGAGLVLLVAGAPLAVGRGDAVVLAGAAAFAGQIVVLSRISGRYDAAALTAGQVGAAGALFVALALASSGIPAPPTGVVGAVVITGLLATSLAFFVQTWAQRALPATPTAIVLATEPAWATLFGIALAADPFPPLRALGALMLLAAPLLAVLGTRPRTAAKSPDG